jgi:hypothetical protein
MIIHQRVPTSSMQTHTDGYYEINLEAFKAIEFNDIFTGRQLRHSVKVL